MSAEGGWLTVEVRDDGVGGTDPTAGTGLRGLADRVSALGGTLEIESPPGEGTVLRARIALDAPERRDAGGVRAEGSASPSPAESPAAR